MTIVQRKDLMHFTNSCKNELTTHFKNKLFKIHLNIVHCCYSCGKSTTYETCANFCVRKFKDKDISDGNLKI